MKTPPSFQLPETELRRGVTLIEASAGTGKTFTIAGLFLRLLIEQKLSVSEILVVTYTEAATEELRGRIRQTLTNAVSAFLAGSSRDPFLQALVERYRGDTADLLARLEQAVSNFDEAPIFTIHGFCQRQLRDRAFESGTLFDTELITDPSALLQEIADDYWRRHFYEAAPLLVRVALKNGLGPDRLQPDLEQHGRHPSLSIVSGVDDRSLDELGAELTATFAKARALWEADRTALHGIFDSSTSWGIKDYGKAETMKEKVADLERCFSEAATPESLKCLKFFSTSSIEEGTGKRSKFKPAHPFFDLCEELGRRENDFLVGLRLDFLKFAKTELPRRKQRLKVQGFDDLLTRLQSALTALGGERLAAEIRFKYKAALIDEFQDTDPIQYEIFSRIFGPRNAENSTPAPLLFLIGDPKQAIYGFRGADFFTYLDAARRADQRFTLDANWRSESGLVTAVNTLFQRSVAPFVFEEIPFHPVIARGKADEEPLREEGDAGAPFELWFYPRAEDGREISQARAEDVLPQAVASEIVRLLNSNTRIGSRRVGPQDIAVLVLKHSQATLMQETLRARNIPSVLHTEASLFGSAEARELHRVLAAIVEPANERLLRAAFATSLLGVSLAELDALTRDPKRWPLCLERFHRYANLWAERGFTPMMRAVLHEEQLRQRLLAFPDGERRLTNVLHLAEALHQAALERRLGPAGLQQWLADHIASEDKAAEEHQLRLERDDFAVKLVTIHKSKGLEYPVVFCPFAWKSSDLKWAGEEQVFFHEQPEGEYSRYVRDLGSAHYEAHRELAFREKLAENVRLLYVALTRARNRCYLVWGNFKNAGTSAPAWLLHPGDTADGASMVQMEERFDALEDGAMRRDLAALADATATDGRGPTLRVRDLPEANDEPYRPVLGAVQELKARPFTGAIEREWRVTSFSALATHQRDERPDYDPTEKPAPAEPAAEGSLFAFPRGTHAGTCLHKIFELLDFTTRDTTEIEHLVRDQLRAHGFDSEKFTGGLVSGVQRALRVPLDPEQPDLLLSSITHDQRLNELEFSFPLQRITPALLQELFTGTEVGDSRLQFDPVRGYLQGFIDLVFEHNGRYYLADWKSNWLGNRVEDYHAPALHREMTERHYRLQYHLYALALHRFLSLRLPGYDYEQHFGGVFYLFVRGIDPARPELGIFRDRPALALMEALSERLIGHLEGVIA